MKPTRPSSPTDYQITVENVGAFTVARRTMRDQFKIAAEYSRITEGVETPTRFLHFYAQAFATCKVLTVSAPDGFDLELIDPLDEGSYAALIAFDDALTRKEEDFRLQSGKGSKTSGTGAS